MHKLYYKRAYGKQYNKDSLDKVLANRKVYRKS